MQRPPNKQPPPASYADLEALPDHVVGELLDGQLITSPRPRLRHALCASALGSLLVTRFQFGQGGPGGWWILVEPELHFGTDAVVPDLAGWRRERMPAVPEKAATELAPDWICEVLSPATEFLDRGRKLALYARRQVRYAWLVNPTPQMLEARALSDGRWVELGVWGGSDRRARIEPFEAAELDLSLLFEDSSTLHER